MEGPGASIAELPVFDGGPYPASSAAVLESQLLFISRNAFREFCLEHPEVALKVLQVVGSRLRRLVGIIEELSFATLRHRLISWLLREAKARLSALAEKVFLRHGERHPSLEKLRDVVNALAAEMCAHMMKEEQALFPSFKLMEKMALSGAGMSPYSGSLVNPINRMMEDHDDTGELFNSIRQLTNNYVPPVGCLHELSGAVSRAGGPGAGPPYAHSSGKQYSFSARA